MKHIEDYKFFSEVSTFNNKEDYSKWLWTTVRGMYLPENGTGNNDFKAFLKEFGHDSVVIGLGHVYERLIDAEKGFFRQSIGQVLLNYEGEETPDGVFEDFIYLIGRIQAVESLNMLVPTVGHGLLGKRDLWWSIIANLKLLAPISPVKEVTLDLTNSPNFDEGYLLEAMGILAKCDPPRVDTFFTDFYPRLTKLRENIQGLGQSERDAYSKASNDLIAQIQRYAPFNTLNIVKQVLLA